LKESRQRTFNLLSHGWGFPFSSSGFPVIPDAAPRWDDPDSSIKIEHRSILVRVSLVLSLQRKYRKVFHQVFPFQQAVFKNRGEKLWFSQFSTVFYTVGGEKLNGDFSRRHQHSPTFPRF
jgi:hypothetical protein